MKTSSALTVLAAASLMGAGGARAEDTTGGQPQVAPAAPALQVNLVCRGTGEIERGRVTVGSVHTNRGEAAYGDVVSSERVLEGSHPSGPAVYL